MFTLITVPVGNNPARVRFLAYYKQLTNIVMKSPADYGGLAAPDYRALNPQGKVPALILPSGEVMFESKVICGYLIDVFKDTGPPVGGETPEERARSALITQVHDLYIASPNSSHASVTATQGCMYKGVDVLDVESRAVKFAELWKQLGVLESLMVLPYAAGPRISEADFALWPTLSCFLPFMLPKYGWGNVMDDEAHFPRLKKWHETVGKLKAAQTVKDEVMGGLKAWEDADRFGPIQEQIASRKDLKWAWP